MRFQISWCTVRVRLDPDLKSLEAELSCGALQETEENICPEKDLLFWST